MFRSEIFRTRVARRIFGLFLVGAVVPVVILGAAAFRAVSQQLRDQSEERVMAVAGNSADAVLERLAQVDREVRQMAVVVRAGAVALGDEGAGGPAPIADVGPLLRNLDAVAVEVDGRTEPLFGSIGPLPEVSPEEMVHLEEHFVGALLKVRTQPDGTRDFLMARAVDEDDPARGVVWGHIVSDSLWATALQYSALPTRASFCVTDREQAALFCDGGSSQGLLTEFSALQPDAVQGLFDGEAGGDAFLAAFREVFLPGSYATPEWYVLISEAESDVYQPMATFATTFPLVLILGILGVGLLTNYQVRQTMTPLQQLLLGTRRLADRDFSEAVVVDSDDEFGTLAESFNLMASELRIRFHQLEAGRSIDRAALTEVEEPPVVAALVRGFASVVRHDRCSVILTRPEVPGDVRVWWTDEGRVYEEEGNLTAEDQALLTDAPGPFVLADPARSPAFAGLARLDPGKTTSLVLPLVALGQLEGIVALARSRGDDYSPEEIDRARYVADQAAVAFNTVRLIDQLQSLNWGTLVALARAIDAKSQWTSGHSERVTRLAVELGRRLDLSEADLQTLHRGGLLHDLGKIGIEGSILDADGPLTPAQRVEMQQHPAIGARILEPVAAFRPMIPIVLQHHERLDGGGYPQGLRADQIDPLAKILAVADTFDAMVSPRPYRPALRVIDVMAYIRAEVDAGYDAEAVAALEAVLADGWVHDAVEPEVGALTGD
jgi:putative nucleotidyltransferase with HDIG domain